MTERGIRGYSVVKVIVGRWGRIHLVFPSSLDAGMIARQGSFVKCRVVFCSMGERGMEAAGTKRCFSTKYTENMEKAEPVRESLPNGLGQCISAAAH